MFSRSAHRKLCLHYTEVQNKELPTCQKPQNGRKDRVRRQYGPPLPSPLRPKWRICERLNSSTTTNSSGQWQHLPNVLTLKALFLHIFYISTIESPQTGASILQSVRKHSSNILIMKTNERHYFSNLFDKVLYMFRIFPLSIIWSISILYTSNRCLSC
jgi:hypothetical protein